MTMIHPFKQSIFCTLAFYSILLCKSIDTIPNVVDTVFEGPIGRKEQEVGHITHYDQLRERALQNYGIVTATIADDLGLRTNEVTRFYQDGRLVRMGYGVYRLADYAPTRLSHYAAAIALVGEGSFLWGKSALALCDLMPHTPGTVFVATKRRVRRTLPSWVEVHKAHRSDVCVEFGNIPCQQPVDALATIADSLTTEQLEHLTHACMESDILRDEQRKQILERLGYSRNEE